MLPVQLFKLLADETRTTIILLLREAGELCVCELCSVTNQSQPKVSRHIALLRDAGLVLDRREGKWIYYLFHHTWLHGQLQSSILPGVASAMKYDNL